MVSCHKLKRSDSGHRFHRKRNQLQYTVPTYSRFSGLVATLGSQRRSANAGKTRIHFADGLLLPWRSHQSSIDHLSSVKRVFRETTHEVKNVKICGDVAIHYIS